MSGRKSILFLCTGNSCRSQMAEGWANALAADRYEVSSAGIEKHGLNQTAAAVMAEAGVDISGQYSKTTDELPRKNFDYVITVCGHANENCPWFPAMTKVLHRGFDDPPRLARDAVSEEEAKNIYRRVRDEIKSFVENLDSFLENG